jgi:hypothetical protein
MREAKESFREESQATTGLRFEDGTIAVRRKT